MFRGLYTATSGMMANNRKQQILTNNLANANTPGYKQDQAVSRAFPEQLLQAIHAGNRSRPIGSLNTGVYTQEGIPSFLQGPLKQTGKSTDVALVDELLPINPANGERGTLLFAVALDNGDVRYSRNGQFSVGADGFLKTSEGYNVLGQDLQPIQVNSDSFTVTEAGQILREDGIANQQLWIGYTENPQALVKEGHGLLRFEGEQGDLPQSVQDVELLNNAGSFVKQGFVEQSNVDLTQTMTEMINTYRSFESNQKVIQAYDRSMERAVNDIGRIY